MRAASRLAQRGVNSNLVTHNPSKSKGLLLIAAFKLIKGLALLAVGIGAFRLLHKDVAAEVASWINFFRVDPERVFIHKLLERLSVVDDHTLKELSIGTFLYSGLLLTEGIGLALRKRWAEYFTIIMTTSFIPLEIYELRHHVTTAKIVVLLINIAVVAYLIYELRRNQSRPSD